MTTDMFTIKDLENLSGIKAHTIRIWEQRYDFIKPLRSDTNIRYYSGNELKTILNIALLNKYGYKISHIDKMDFAALRANILGLQQPEAQFERTINDLISYMIDLDLVSFEARLNQIIISKGIEKTITQIIFPFLDKIGILWVTNHINPAQEHLTTNIIRQKLIVGIDKLAQPIAPAKKVLLFLPEGEHHEMGLLFMHYLLKSRGVNVLYLGANISFKDLGFIIAAKTPDYVYTHLTAVANNFSLEKFIKKLEAVVGQIPVGISGQQVQRYNYLLPANFSLRKSLPAVLEFVDGL